VKEERAATESWDGDALLLAFAFVPIVKSQRREKYRALREPDAMGVHIWSITNPVQVRMTSRFEPEVHACCFGVVFLVASM